MTSFYSIHCCMLEAGKFVSPDCEHNRSLFAPNINGICLVKPLFGSFIAGSMASSMWQVLYLVLPPSV